jgi:hypothetical protein
MARSEALSVRAYLDELPEDRREVVSKVRDVILASLPDGYSEAMRGGLITYEVPIERYPDTYNGRPLAYIALAAQKNHYALYLVGAYQDPNEARRLKEGFAAAGKKLDMGKSCVRFRKLEDLPLDVIARSVASTRVGAFVARHERGRAGGVGG